MENLENSGIGQSLEREQREKLIARALNTLTKNIEFIGQKETRSLKRRLLEADQNPMRQASEVVLPDFNKVEVHGNIGAGRYEGSVFLKPYLTHKAREEGRTRIYVQPMGLHLDMLEAEREQRLELAEQIWSGVSKEEKIALASNYIEWKKTTEINGLAHLSTLIKEGDYTEVQAKRFEVQHKHVIQILSELETAVKDNTFSVDTDDEDASLIFSPIKRTKEK